MNDVCKHCGTQYRPKEGTGEFCCSGCEHVYRLIQDEGLDGYYDHQDRVGRPLRESPFAHRDLLWVDALQASAEEAPGIPELQLRIVGMSCVGCVWLVERLAKRSHGVRSARVSLSAHRLDLAWSAGEFNLKTFIQELQRFGYRADPFERGVARPVSALAWRVILCGIFAVNSLLLAAPDLLGVDDFVYADLFVLLSLLFAGLSFAVGGALFMASAWRSLRCLRMSYDLLAGAIVVAVLFVTLVFPFFYQQHEPQAWVFSLSVFALLLGPWLFCLISGRGRSSND